MRAARSHIAFMTAAIARWTTPFSGPSHRSCESAASSRYVPPRSPTTSSDVAPDQGQAALPRRLDAQIVAAADREGEAVALRSPGRRCAARRRRRSSRRPCSSRPSRPSSGTSGSARRDLDAGDACHGSSWVGRDGSPALVEIESRGSEIRPQGVGDRTVIAVDGVGDLRDSPHPPRRRRRPGGAAGTPARRPAASRRGVRRRPSASTRASEFGGGRRRSRNGRRGRDAARQQPGVVDGGRDHADPALARPAISSSACSSSV